MLGDLLDKRPTLSTDQDTLVVIDNAPKVKPELMEKLKRILKKVVGKFGTIISEYYPVDENNVFKGYVCFMHVYIMCNLGRVHVCMYQELPVL